MSVNFLTYLPEETNLEILSYLDPQTVCRFCQVSHEANRLASDDRLWRALFPQAATPETDVKAYIESRAVKSIKEIQEYIQVFIENIQLNTKGSFFCQFPFNPKFHISIGYKSGTISPDIVANSREIVESPDFQLVCYFMKPEEDKQPHLGLDIQGGPSESFIVTTKILLPTSQQENMAIASSFGRNVRAHLVSLKTQSLFSRIFAAGGLALAAVGLIYFMKGK